MHDDLALGFTPDALPDTTFTIYPGLGPALYNTDLCSLVTGLAPDSTDAPFLTEITWFGAGDLASFQLVPEP